MIIILVPICRIVDSVFKLTLESGQRIVIKFDLTLRHPTYFYYFLEFVEGKLFVDFGTIQEFQRYFLNDLFCVKTIMIIHNFA